MRCGTSSLLLCLLAAAGSSLAADRFAADKFAEDVRIQAGGAPIDSPGYRAAAPFVGDFDGDGLEDLLVGQSDPGRLRIYRNVGSKQEPRFEDFEWLRVNGEIVELPGGGTFRPQLADLDGDGNVDIVAASWSGLILWYRRTAGGQFDEAEIIRLANGQVLNAGSNAACHAADWDGDGDMDLIIAGRPSPDARATVLSLVENGGAPRSLSLAAPRPLEIEGEPIQAQQIDVYPFVADWNRDGKQDLLLGIWDGSVLLYENAGDRRAPRLTKPRPLVEPPRRGGHPDGPDVLSRGPGGSLCIADWDDDGNTDILIGDLLRVTSKPDASGAAEKLEKARQDAGEVLSEYRRLRRLGRRLENVQGNQREFVAKKRRESYRRLETLRDTISKLEQSLEPVQESHGYVWLLRRVPEH